MIWIISGPTSAGKSTFIASTRSTAVTGLSQGTPVVRPTAKKLSSQLDRPSAYLHYNILRPHDLLHQASLRGERLDPQSAEFDQDPSWVEILEHDATKMAVVLVASKQTIMERIRKRTTVEEPRRAGRTAKRYNNEKWETILNHVDLPALYRAWCHELQGNGIPYVLIDSRDKSYAVVQDAQHLADILYERSGMEDMPTLPAREPSRAESAYNLEEIAELLQDRGIGCHSVDLPYALPSVGQDCSETGDLVLPKSLAGKSVLDVGCGLGRFCFEAEARGATRVVGVDVRERRVREALQIKDTKGSKVEFVHRDFVLDPLEEQFDYVLLLNVIHHLYEPVRAIRQLASITKERLIIEFSTLEDPKFGASIDTQFSRDFASVPLVGVSSMRPGVGQTFVFSPLAMQRILLDHDRLFDTVDIVNSSKPGRAIALCNKAPSELDRPTDDTRRRGRRAETRRERMRLSGADRD